MSEWISCTDELPPNDNEVVGWDKYQGALIVWYEIGSHEWFWRHEGRDDNWLGKDLTHWMHIPPTLFVSAPPNASYRKND